MVHNYPECHFQQIQALMIRVKRQGVGGRGLTLYTLRKQAGLYRVCSPDYIGLYHIHRTLTLAPNWSLVLEKK
jgi:hypothetical protein